MTNGPSVTQALQRLQILFDTIDKVLGSRDKSEAEMGCPHCGTRYRFAREQEGSYWITSLPEYYVKVDYLPVAIMGRAAKLGIRGVVYPCFFCREEADNAHHCQGRETMLETRLRLLRKQGRHLLINE